MSKIGVIILAAGKGTRMKSEKPKVCFNLGGKSLVQRVVNTALTLKADLVTVVVGYKKEMVINSILNHPNIIYVTQKNQNGTGDAVKSTRESYINFNGTVFVLCGDVPLLNAETLQNMLQKHKKSRAKCTVLTMTLEKPDKYGRIVRNEKGFVKEIVEYKDASETIRNINEINTGIYCFEGTELFQALEKIDNDNAQKEYYLTDVIKILNSQNKIIESVELSDISEAAGVNSLIELAYLEKEHYRVIRNFWMNNGVNIENPETVLIEEDVVIEPDVFISANVKISGESHIKKNAYIGPNSVIKDSIIAENSYLEGGNFISKIKNVEGFIKWGKIIKKLFL